MNEAQATQLLLLSCSNCDVKSVEKYSPYVKDLSLALRISCRRSDNLEVIEYLLSLGEERYGNISEILMTACLYGELKYIKLLVEHGAKFSTITNICLKNIRNRHKEHIIEFIDRQMLKETLISL